MFGRTRLKVESEFAALNRPLIGSKGNKNCFYYRISTFRRLFREVRFELYSDWLFNVAFSLSKVTSFFKSVSKIHSELNRNLQANSMKERRIGCCSAVATGGQGACPPFWFTHNTVFGTSCNDKATDNDGKRNNYVQT